MSFILQIELSSHNAKLLLYMITASKYLFYYKKKMMLYCRNLKSLIWVSVDSEHLML